MDTRTSPIRTRIQQLQEALVQAGVHALLVPSSDPHLPSTCPSAGRGGVAVGLHRLDGDARRHGRPRRALRRQPLLVSSPTGSPRHCRLS